MKPLGVALVAVLLSIPLAAVAYLMFSVLYGGAGEPLEW